MLAAGLLYEGKKHGVEVAIFIVGPIVSMNAGHLIICGRGFHHEVFKVNNASWAPPPKPSTASGVIFNHDSLRGIEDLGMGIEGSQAYGQG